MTNKKRFFFLLEKSLFVLKIKIVDTADITIIVHCSILDGGTTVPIRLQTNANNLQIFLRTTTTAEFNFSFPFLGLIFFDQHFFLFDVSFFNKAIEALNNLDPSNRWQGF